MASEQTVLRPDELAYLASDTMRCATCGHLARLHNDHCCDYCLIPDCECSWNNPVEYNPDSFIPVAGLSAGPPSDGGES